MQVIFLPTSICVLHSNFWYLHINSLLEWRFYYFHMFRNQIHAIKSVSHFEDIVNTWTGAERHAWRNRYWRSRGQIVYRRYRRNGARLLQRTLCKLKGVFTSISLRKLKHHNIILRQGCPNSVNIDIVYGMWTTLYPTTTIKGVFYL